jgi:hypothetical protein
LPATLLRSIFCALFLLSANLASAADRPIAAPLGETGRPDKKPDTTQPPIGCSRTSWLAGKCSNHPATSPQYPDYPTRPPYPDRDPYRRPIIVQPAPAPAEETPLTDDWESCRSAKVSQLNSQQNGDRSRARQLDEWLWKNCRTYSEELRQLEQDRM